MSFHTDLIPLPLIKDLFGGIYPSVKNFCFLASCAVLDGRPLCTKDDYVSVEFVSTGAPSAAPSVVPDFCYILSKYFSYILCPYGVLLYSEDTGLPTSSRNLKLPFWSTLIAPDDLSNGFPPASMSALIRSSLVKVVLRLYVTAGASCLGARPRFFGTLGVGLDYFVPLGPLGFFGSPAAIPAANDAQGAALFNQLGAQSEFST